MPVAVNGPLSVVSVVVRPFADHIPTKSGTFDHGVLMDDKEMPWIGPALLELRKRRLSEFSALRKNRSRLAEDEALWPFTPAEMLKDYKKAGAALGIGQLTETVYKLRHGGASRDVLGNRRALLEVQRRGNWASQKSLTRYERSGAVPSQKTRSEGHDSGQEVPAGSHKDFSKNAVTQPNSRFDVSRNDLENTHHYNCNMINL